jgi:hypothetical protein
MTQHIAEATVDKPSHTTVQHHETSSPVNLTSKVKDMKLLNDHSESTRILV